MDAWETIKQLEARLNEEPHVASQLIQAYEEIAGVLEPDDDPFLHAFIQTGLGTAYLMLPTGNRTAHLAQAITCLQQALQYLDPATHPDEYARAQNNLGLAYSGLPINDPGVNLIHAIACYQEALRFWTPESSPLNYAHVQTNLGIAYWELPTGKRVHNLEQAIACHQEALHFFTPETTPFDYAMAQTNLGIAYNELPTGDRSTHLTRAIACYQEALRFVTPANASFEYARIQANLGSTYRDLLLGDRSANLSQAILCFQEALQIWTPETAPAEYAMTQTNLGNAYLDLPTYDRATTLTRAIACYQEALHFFDPESSPFNYAHVQTNLGNAYNQLPSGDRATNLTNGIACLQEALRYWQPEASPLDYAGTLIDLGNAYSDLPTGDRVANLTQAIACYQEALRFWTPETHPFEYARTQTYLGDTYSVLPTGNQAENLQRAIACHQEALRFWTPGISPFHYAVAQSNLGNTYWRFSTSDRSMYLERVLTCYQEALRFWTPETFPFHYAVALTNLGSTYQNLPTGNRETNLQRAIACHQEALRIWTPENAPLYYALAQANLGSAYRDLPIGNRTANLRQAIAYYQEALRFRTPTTAPFECRTTNRNLAQLYLAQKEWSAALRAYRAAMDAGERLYHAGLSIESKTIELAENVKLYRHAAFAAVRCGETTEALLILERGKTRLLADALRLRVPRPANVPDEVWCAFEDAGAGVRTSQFIGTTMLGVERDPVQSYTAREQAAQAASTALDTAIERVQVYAPDFLHAIDLPSIQGLLLDTHIVLVAFCITEQGSMGFVVSHNYDQNVQMIEVPHFTQAELRRLLVELDADGRAVGGWLGAYNRFQMEDTQAAEDVWKNTITNTLAELSQHLLVPILSALPPDIELIIFLPSAELFLLPLHAAPLAGMDSERVCDRYQVSYAPSIGVLANVRAKALQKVSPELYAVINPTADPRLPFTPLEGRAIARLFKHQYVSEGRPAGKKQEVIVGVRGRSYVHFSCHGSYDWEDPTRSGLELADGRLTLDELQRGVVDLSTARLVTLSACETGITDVFQGSAEEYVGIPAGFLLAGVPCVVSALWEVPDISTAFLMERLYHNHVNGGMDIAAALREAQRWMRQLKVGEVAKYTEQWYRQPTGRKTSALFTGMRHYQLLTQRNPDVCPFAHPYYWAAFTVNGL